MTKERVRYDALIDYTTYVSTTLVKKYGLQPGETVALFSPNTIWYPVAMLGTIRAGGIISGASPAYNIEEMTYALKTAHAKILMTVPSSMSVAIPAAQNAGIPRERIFLLEGDHEGYTTMQQLLEMGKSYDSDQTPAFKIPQGKTNRDVCAFLSFSSGTTGLPKAVMIAHHNVIAQCMQVQQVTPPEYKRALAVLPLFHITGLVHQMHLPVLLNIEVIMIPSFTMDTMLKAVSEYKISDLLLVPPLVIRLVHDATTSKYDLSHITRFTSGAAPISGELLQKLEVKFPQTGFKQGYGMTESCSCITTHPPDQQSYKYAARVGTIVANTDVKIIDVETGKELGYNEQGEILARGPQITMGYLNNEKATRETFDSDGWLHTGDVGYIDHDGFITITDRIKEMIKVKGIGVSPAELEDLLLGHHAVADAAVTSIPDAYSGERPKAFVVARETDLDEAALVELGRQLIKYVHDNKVRHKAIAEVEFVKEIPKSASGKILRRLLKNKPASGLVVREDVRAKL